MLSTRIEGDGSHILVVDDDWMSREVIETYLRLIGYRVSAVHSGDTALEIAFSDPPDLVMLDVIMPGMDGYEVCYRLKSDKRTRFTPVVIVTALESDEDQLRAVEAGADDFLTKPFNSILMATRVKSLLRIKRLYEDLEPRKLPQAIGSEKCWVTVCSVGIRGFTTFAVEQTADEAVMILNWIFSELADVALRFHGTLAYHAGEQFTVFFGAPTAGDDDVYHALRMALEMKRVLTTLKTQTDMDTLELSIGLHSGHAIVGNVGVGHHMSYTVIGEPVNMAHELQHIALPRQVLISETVFQQVEPKRVQVNKLPEDRVYELLNVWD